jgi:hypothetical protein
MIVALAALFAGCGSSSKMDSTLNKLEKTCHKAQSISKRMKAGDQTAGTEMAAVMKEYQNFAASLKDAGTMTLDQQKRYDEIMQSFMQTTH